VTSDPFMKARMPADAPAAAPLIKQAQR
jgi:hypothetical protein